MNKQLKLINSWKLSSWNMTDGVDVLELILLGSEGTSENRRWEPRWPQLSLEKNYFFPRGFSYVNSFKKKFQAEVNPLLVETNTNGKHHVIIFYLLIKSSCPEGTTFYTQGLFNKQVCLTSSAQPVPGLGLAGCYRLQPTALRDRTSCLLCTRLKASLMAKLARGLGLQTSSLLQDRKLHTTRSQHSSIKILASEVQIGIQKITRLTC